MVKRSCIVYWELSSEEEKNLWLWLESKENRTGFKCLLSQGRDVSELPAALFTKTKAKGGPAVNTKQREIAGMELQVCSLC